jgi:cellulose synthase (UDP-forming)
MKIEPTRFEQQVPWKPSHHSTLHEAVWQFLATGSLVFGFWYIWWRWTASLNWGALWFSLPLVVAETGAFVGLILFSFNLWTARPVPLRAPPRTLVDTIAEAEVTDRPIMIDVFFATYSEDPELVRLGLKDAKALEYPYAVDIVVYVLDDGKRPEMRAVAEEEGATYLTRPDNIGYKAGNLRNALANSSGDFIVICDADTRPFPNFLIETMGYFCDPKVAWVQTPQWFSDIPPGVPLPAWLGRRIGSPGRVLGRGIEWLIGPVRLGEDPFANDPQLFYDFILRRRNWANAAFCCGAGSIHRREAVVEAGLRQWSEKIVGDTTSNERKFRKITGDAAIDENLRQLSVWQSAVEEEFTPYKFHVSEDIYTSIALHSDRERGWKSVQHPVVVSKMLSPNDLLSWTIQRFKYAGGTLDILRTDNPLFRPGLTLPQRIMYGSTFYSYLSPVWNVIFIVWPIIFLFTGIAPISGYSLNFFLHIVPFLLLNELAQLIGMWGVSAAKGRAWYMAMFPLNIQALWAVARGRNISFPVTPKDRQVGSYPRLVKWQILVVVLIIAGLVWGWGAYARGVAGYGLGAMIANTLWGLNNGISMLPIIRAAFWQPDPEFEAAIFEGGKA